MEHVCQDVTLEIVGGIGDFRDYEKAFKLLPLLTPNDTLQVRLNTPGGSCDTGFHLVDRIRGVECPVQMVVDYPTYSMGAILALCGDDLLFQEGTYIMFHDYSGGMHGKGGETQDYGTNFRTVFRKKFERICKPFLTQAECNKMFKGEDIYIHDDDPTLPSRMKRHFKKDIK